MAAKVMAYQSIPSSPQKRKATHNPTEDSSFSSRLFFAWARPLLRVGNDRPLHKDDLWPVESKAKCQHVSETFEASFHTTKSIPKSIVYVFGRELAASTLLQAVNVVSTVAGPIAIKQVLAAMESSDSFDLVATSQLIAVFFGLRAAAALSNAHANFWTQMVAINVTTALQHLLFHKTLRLSVASRRDKTAGEIANMFSGDVQTLIKFATYSNNVILAPLQILITLYLLYGVLGWASFVALGVILLGVVGNMLAYRNVHKTYDRIAQARDARMKSINEVFGAMQTIKMNSWEDKFIDKINGERTVELNGLKTFAHIAATAVVVMYLGPALVSIASFGTYTLVLQEPLPASKLFTALSLFSVIRQPMYQLPQVAMRMAQALVAFKRFKTFLDLPEQDFERVMTPSTADIDTLMVYRDGEIAVAMENATIGWDDKQPLFENVNLTIKRGEFVVVHGSVGEGKSSLCSALLGEMDKLSGRIFVDGRLAYFSQQSWIQNMTIRENILFGKPYDRVKYNRVIEACALTADLAQFPANDRTEIGQKGVNLSGGQKARISLARACYSDADIFILDSPLSAVDAIVQNEIFTKCFLGLLRNKTIVLVTHSPEIIESKFMDGTIEVKGGMLIQTKVDREDHPILIEPLCDAFGKRDPSLADISTSAALESNDIILSPTLTFAGPLFTPLPSTTRVQMFNETKSGQFVDDEESASGKISNKVYKSYFNAVGGWPTLIGIVVANCVWQGLMLTSDLWLNRWSSTAAFTTPQEFTQQSCFYLGVYAALAIIAVFSSFAQCVTTMLAGVAASRTLFGQMTQSLFRAPLKFFDANPIGRILNRYSSDMTVVDQTLPLVWFNFIPHFAIVAFGLGTAMVVIQLYGLAVVPFIYIYVLIGRYYVQPAREIERLSKTTKSSLLNLISESIDGVPIIRAFGPKQVTRFLRTNARNLDMNNEALFAAQVLTQWFTLHVQLTSAVIILVVMSSVVALRNFLSPGLVGLALTYLFSNMGYVEYIIVLWTQIETSMVSPERIAQYANIESEAPRVISGAVSQEWPAKGTIEFTNMGFRYKENEPLVLKDVNVHIQAGEKIGIVGRTGAGKSSLTMALFRINELAAGSIKIDGVDIAKVGVKTLRSAIAIIPQTPVLFKGTLRNYLDPFGAFTDEELWLCLRKVNLVDRISSAEGKLDSAVDENGENFSVGERQMLCMARALLRKARIVVMDEATAAIDHETDQNLQRVIRTEFASSTVLTIAHRLDTVCDSDRILVFDQGRLVQCDTPKALIAQGSGIFYDLCSEGGYLAKIIDE
ncbi:unnamed protein product [Aphanomyces euteiches]